VVANASAAVVELLTGHVSVVEDQAVVSIASCRARGVLPPFYRGDDDRDGGGGHVVDSSAVDANEDAGGDDASVEEDVGGGGGGLADPCSGLVP
jgi:hypothetical protein